MQDLNRCTEIQYPLMRHMDTEFQYIDSSLAQWKHRNCKTWIDVLNFSILFWGTSYISVPQLWRDSLLFNGFSNYFHSIHQTYRSHIGATGVIAMLSLCRTWIEVLKLSLHSWGTSSVSVPQLWRDSLFFNGLSNYFHSIHQTYRSHMGATGVIPMLSLGHFFNFSTTAVKR